MNGYADQVREAVRAVRIHSATSYSWLGQRSPRLPNRVTAALAPPRARAFLRSSLETTLYADFYCRGGVAEPQRTESPQAPAGRTPFVESLSRANGGRGHVQPGWTVRRVEGARLVLHKNGLDLWVEPGECVVDSPHHARLGMTVGLRQPKELLQFSPGFYLAFGDRQFPASVPVEMMRLYWNLKRDGAEPLIRAVTTLLNGAGLAFKVKVLANPEQYGRCDAGVLYLLGSDLKTHDDTIAAVYGATSGHLRTRTPAFTRVLAPGLGLAEDAADGASFGVHRCGLVAEGIIRAHERGQRSLDDRVGSVLGCFEEAGIDIDAPFLAPGSTDVYALQFPVLDGRRG